MSNGKPNEIVLRIHGLGHVPSFKNKKMITRGRLITDPKKQRWMKSCIQSFVSQLISRCQTEGSGTSPEFLKRFATASLPLDDNWLELEIGKASCELVEKGNEGAIVVVEKV